jgi:hypothetical protein
MSKTKINSHENPTTTAEGVKTVRESRITPKVMPEKALNQSRDKNIQKSNLDKIEELKEFIRTAPKEEFRDYVNEEIYNQALGELKGIQEGIDIAKKIIEEEKNKIIELRQKTLKLNYNLKPSKENIKKYRVFEVTGFENVLKKLDEAKQ